MWTLITPRSVNHTANHTVNQTGNHKVNHIVKRITQRMDRHKFMTDLFQGCSKAKLEKGR